MRKPLLSPRAGVAIFVISAVCFGVFILLPFYLRDVLWKGSQGYKEWIFWFQVASGNWAPDAPPVGRWAFAVSAVIAVMLNNALWIAAGVFIWRFVKTWRLKMQVGQAFVTRDQMNKQALFRKFDPADPDIREKINQAFKEGERDWRENLHEVFGQEKANQILDLLQSTVE